MCTVAAIGADFCTLQGQQHARSAAQQTVFGGPTMRISYSAIMRTMAAFWAGEDLQMTTLPQRAPQAANSASVGVPRTWLSVAPSMTSSPGCTGAAQICVHQQAMVREGGRKGLSCDDGLAVSCRDSLCPRHAERGLVSVTPR